MDTEKERMLAFLSAVSTALDPSSGFIQGLPNSYIHSNSSVHSCPNSTSSAHLYPNSSSNISCCSHSTNIYSCSHTKKGINCPYSNRNVTNCSYSSSNPHSCLNSNNSLQSQQSNNNNNIHSCPNSNQSIYVCPKSTQSANSSQDDKSHAQSHPDSNYHIHSCVESNNVYHCSYNSKSVHSCLSSVQNINIPSEDFPMGSNISCASSANLNSQSIQKLWQCDSDAETDLLSVCRICQLPGDDKDDLFSPCRCSGSLKDVHYSCLRKWIEISTRKTRKNPRCELCQFLYNRQKHFKFHNWHLPRVSTHDKCLHSIFIFSLLVMLACAVMTIMCFMSSSGHVNQSKSHLSMEEVVTLACGVLFFAFFFVGMTVEMKARHTIYRLFLKFLVINTEWIIEPYDKAKDLDHPMYYKDDV